MLKTSVSSKWMERMTVSLGLRLVLYLVREIFFLSGESQGILTTDVCDERAKSERLIKGQRE